MNQYFYVTIQTMLDETQPMAIYGKESYDAALQTLYSDMAYAINNTNCMSIICLIINSIGNVERKETWYRPAPTVNPSVEE